MKHFPPLHGIDRAIMKFSSPTHTQNARFPTIFTVLGRYFFHRSTPHNHTVLRRGDLSFTQPPGAPPAWRTPKEPSTPRDAEPDHGAGGRQRGLAGLVQATQVPPIWRPPEGLAGQTAEPVGGGGARASTRAPSPARLEAAAGPAGPGRASSRRAERSSQRGRRAGGQATRRPEIRRASSTAGDQAGNSTAGNQAISDSRAPSGSPIRRRHPPGRAGAPNRRPRARDPRPRQ